MILAGSCLAGVILVAGGMMISGTLNVQAADLEQSSGPTGKQEVILVQPPVKNHILEKRGRGGHPLIVVPATDRGVKLWDEAKYPLDKPESLQGNNATGLAGKH